MESWGLAHVHRCLHEYESLTTDLGGSEASVTEFRWHKESMNSLVPEWYRGQEREPMQVEFDSESVHVLPDFDVVQCEGDFVLRNAMPIPGSNHAVHGVDKYCNESMTHYKQFLADLHQVERLLTRPGRNERFVPSGRY